MYPYPLVFQAHHFSLVLQNGLILVVLGALVVQVVLVDPYFPGLLSDHKLVYLDLLSPL